MSERSTYNARCYDYLHDAGIDKTDLPASLHDLIEKFDRAKDSWEQAEENIQYQLLPVLVQTDAVISAQIFQLYKDQLKTGQVDKIKLMALKAKALQLKWKLKNE